MNSNNTSQLDRDDSSQNSSIDRTFINEALDRQREIIFEEFSHRFGSNLKSASQRDNFDFKNEGLKKQFNFNNDRLEKLSELEALLDCGNLETFKYVLAKEKQEIKDRNKILKIADSHGWDTVREYSADPLADNNEDASKLRSAINRARYARKFKPYDFKTQGFNSSSALGAAPSRFPAGFQLFPEPQARFGAPLQTTQTRYSWRNPQPNQLNTQPICFSCHLRGHIANECPFRYRQLMPAQQKLGNGQSSTTDKSSAEDAVQQ